MSNHAGEFGREAWVAVLDVSGQSRGDFLEHPAVAIRVAERGVRGVALSLRICAGDQALSFGMMEYAVGVVEWLADCDASTKQVLAGGLDVGNDQMQPL